MVSTGLPISANPGARIDTINLQFCGAAPPSARPLIAIYNLLRVSGFDCGRPHELRLMQGGSVNHSEALCQSGKALIECP